MTENEFHVIYVHHRLARLARLALLPARWLCGAAIRWQAGRVPALRAHVDARPLDPEEIREGLDPPPATPRAPRRGAEDNAGAYTAAAASSLFPTFRSAAIRLDVSAPFRATNPSVAIDGERGACVVRMHNHAIIDGRFRVDDPLGQIRSRSAFFELDPDLRPTAPVELRDPRRPSAFSTASALGFIDCRLFRWRDAWHCVASTREGNRDGRAEMAVLRIERGRLELLAVADEIESHADQKNWMPVVRSGELDLVVHVDPTLIVRFDQFSRRFRTIAEHVPPVPLRHVRGGSPGLPTAGGWIFLTHDEPRIDGEKRSYVHRFLLLDRELRFSAVSAPFHFLESGAEFAAGLARHAASGRLIASFGRDNREARLAFFDEREVLGALSG
jgi:hypothetical protein